LLQLNELCKKYDIKFKEPMPLIFNNGWLSNFIYSGRSVNFNKESEPDIYKCN